jgi:hypothetical protein
LMCFAVSIRRTAGEMASQAALRTGYMREKGQTVLGGDSLNRPPGVVESFPFEMY